MPIAKLARCFHRKISQPILKRFYNTDPVVAVIRLQGVIGGTGRFRPGGLDANTLGPIIRKAFKQSHLKAVALAINSPGGSPVQSDLIARAIRQEAAKKEVPVFAFIEDVGASGGYWLACAGDEIYALEASIIGSIGVIASGFGLQEFIRRHGIERRMYTQGENKAMLDPFQPEKEEDVAHLLHVQKNVHESFKYWVETRREDKLKHDRSELFSGKFWAGRESRDLGLIDGLGDLRGICIEKFGKDTRFVPHESSKGFFAKKLGMLNPGNWVQALLDGLEEKLLWARFSR